MAPDIPGRQRSRLPLLKPADLSPEQLNVYEAVTGGRRQHPAGSDGYLDGPFNAMLHSPKVGGPLQALGAAVRFDSSLPSRAREIAILMVAAKYNSGYEWRAHEIQGREIGLDERELSAIRTGTESELGDPIEQAVVMVTRALLRRGDLTDDEYTIAERHLKPSGLVDLSTLIGYYSLLAIQLRVFRVPPLDI